ncbi:MAG: Fic family protein [Robiginitomaculum sp.]|nr:Fic family protein [Robiginitomaculum sp.]
MSYETDIDALFATYTSLLPMKKEDKDRLWQKFRLDWNYNSNRIEGNTLTYGETEALLILGTEPKRLQRDIREMKAHDIGIEYLRDLVDSRRYITEANIRELNQIILKQNYWIETETADGNISRKEIIPGTYKKTPNHVRLRGGGIHKFAEPQDVPTRMESTVKSIREYLKKPDTTLAKFLAELHHDFINTHPFDDGNGRVCRMLLNYVCLKLGWPPVIIKDKNKDGYLLALEQSDGGNLSALEALMKSELEWSLKKSIAAARGEDIEDADDVDKEIQNFVSEHTQRYRTDNNVKRLHLNCTIPIMEKLENKISQFIPLFTEFSTTLQATDLYYEVQNNQMLDCKSLGFAYHLEEYKSDVYNADIQTNISVKVSSHNYEVKCEVRSHNGQQSKFIDFPQTDYNVPIQEGAVDKFCSKIGHAILEVVKDYKLKSTET